MPHDFSQSAARALEVAAGLAERSGGELTLLHVSPLPPNLPADAMITSSESAAPAPIAEVLTDGACRELAAIAAPLRARGLRVQTFARATEPGSPAEAILRIAGELAADVIVLGTHGRRGLSRLLLGSVAEKIIRGASVPVVTIRSGGDEAPPTREELIASAELAG